MSDSLRRRVEELESRYQLIADNLVDAIWVMDVESLRLDFITPSVRRISGYSAEEITGLAAGQRMTPASLEALRQGLAEERRLFEQGLSRKFSLELELIHQQGHPYWIEITAKLFKDESGRLKLAGLSRDIGRRKQVERERERLIRDLGKALAEKEALLKENKVLRGLLPICAGCKRIRDQQGRWWPLEAYVQAHSQAEFTHTVCGQCQEIYYADILSPQK